MFKPHIVSQCLNHRMSCTCHDVSSCLLPGDCSIPLETPCCSSKLSKPQPWVHPQAQNRNCECASSSEVFAATPKGSKWRCSRNRLDKKHGFAQFLIFMSWSGIHPCQGWHGEKDMLTFQLHCTVHEAIGATSHQHTRLRLRQGSLCNVCWVAKNWWSELCDQ